MNTSRLSVPSGPTARRIPSRQTAESNSAIRSRALRVKVMAARAAYRATLDATGRGSEDAYRAMEEAEAAWDASVEEVS